MSRPAQSARPARYGRLAMQAPTAPAAAHPAASAAARFGLLAAVLLLATACSAGPGLAGTTSAGTPPAGHVAFLASVDRVCARAVAAHPFPLPGFDPEHPRPSQLPTAGNYFARYGSLPQTAKALHGLTPPAADTGTWRHLLDVADQTISNAQHQIAVARARNVVAFIQTVRTANRLAAQINAAGARFGFTPNSSFSQVFG